MIAQVTAAALTSENKALAVPHSVDSISTSGNQEDYVSMGMSGARRLSRMLENLRHTIAIELLCACQGIDLLAPLKTGTLATTAYEAVRAKSASCAWKARNTSCARAMSCTSASTCSVDARPCKTNLADADLVEQRRSFRRTPLARG